jgi:hypothetical protein
MNGEPSSRWRNRLSSQRMRVKQENLTPEEEPKDELPAQLALNDQ